jgi:hypothetical protein
MTGYLCCWKIVRNPSRKTYYIKGLWNIRPLCQGEKGGYESIELYDSHRERRLNESTPNSSQSDRSSKDVKGAERD